MFEDTMGESIDELLEDVPMSLDTEFEDVLEYHEEEKPKLFFTSAVDFSLYIENRAREDGESLIDTLIAFCDEYNLDIVRIKNLISKSLFDKLKQEFVDRGMIQESETIDSFLC